MMIDLGKSSWPVARAGEAMQALGAQARLPYRSTPLPQAPGAVLKGDRDACRTWIDSTAACLGLEVEPKPVTYKSLPELLGRGFSLLGINVDDGPRLLAIVGSGRGRVMLIPPGLTPVRMTVAKLRSAIAAPLENKIHSSLRSILDEVGIAGPSRSRVLQSLLDDRLGGVRIAESWALNLRSSASWWTHARHAGLTKTLVAFLGAYGLEYALWIISWMLVGRWALEGQFDRGWLLGWGMLLLTIIPVHMLAMWHQARLAISGGWVMMRLLLEGSFKLKPEEVRYPGVGQLLGRVLDSTALQSLALAGGLLSLIAVIELAVSAALLAIGAESWLLTLLLLLWMALTVALMLAYHRRRRQWTSARLHVTEELIERMVGHRTRLAQQARTHWHDGEDESLARYLEQSKHMDWLNITCMGLLPRGWLLVGIAAMVPGVVAGSHSTGILATRLGGIFLAYTALRRLSSALATLSGAVIAAERAREFLQAAKRTEPPGDPAIAVAAASSPASHRLEMRDVTFRYPHRATEAVRHAFLEIEEGDRILLQGRSGSGKSTCVALASGLRLPDSGLLFLRGIDRKTLGDRDWRRRVVAVAQFHENHIFSESLAFNLLMGRRWPAEPEDLREAESLCRELGLGVLLDSMPGGLMQMVGESGWQLSNGEKNRVYLARALLQGADVVALDETFAALDPETAQQVIDCVLRRASTVLCVAHV